MSALIRVVHLVLAWLIFSHVHVTEPGLHRLGADRENQE